MTSIARVPGRLGIVVWQSHSFGSADQRFGISANATSHTRVVLVQVTCGDTNSRVGGHHLLSSSLHCHLPTFPPFFSVFITITEPISTQHPFYIVNPVYPVYKLHSHPSPFLDCSSQLFVPLLFIMSHQLPIYPQPRFTFPEDYYNLLEAANVNTENLDNTVPPVAPTSLSYSRSFQLSNEAQLPASNMLGTSTNCATSHR